MATDEHVMGKWVSRRAGNPLLRIAGVKRHYGTIRIRCCDRCNGGPMRKMEGALAGAFEAQNREAVGEVPDHLWAAWACKVMYGLLASEFAGRGIDIDIRVTLTDQMEAVRSLAITYRTLFRAYLTGNAHGTLLSVIPLQTQHDRAKRDVTAFVTDEIVGTMVLQILGLAVIVSVRDCGYCSDLENEYTDAAKSLELNPIQLVEIYCRYVDHMNSRVSVATADPVPSSFGIEVRRVGVNLPGPPVSGFLAGLLRRRLEPLGFAPGDIQDPPQTWLLDYRGLPRHLPIDQTRGRSSH